MPLINRHNRQSLVRLIVGDHSTLQSLQRFRNRRMNEIWDRIIIIAANATSTRAGLGEIESPVAEYQQVSIGIS